MCNTYNVSTVLSPIPSSAWLQCEIVLKTKPTSLRFRGVLIIITMMAIMMTITIRIMMTIMMTLMMTIMIMPMIKITKIILS